MKKLNWLIPSVTELIEILVEKKLKYRKNMVINNAY